ncbi:MAG: MFS transporter [Thermoplasmata archaeon]
MATSSRDPAIPPAPRAGALGLLLSSRVLRGVAAGLVNIGFPYLLLVDLHSGAFILGLLYATGSLSTAGLSYAVSRYGSRRALRPAFLLSLALLPVACALLVWNPNLLAAALASVIGGFSATGSLAGGGVGGVAFPLQTTILSDLVAPAQRTRWFSYFTFIASIAAAGGSLWAGFIDLPTLFTIALIVSLVSVIVSIPIPIRPIERGRKPSARSREVIRRFTWTGVLNGFSQGLLTPFLIPFFVVVFAVPRPEMAVYSTVSSLIGTFALLGAPALERRWGFVRAIVGTRLIAAALAAIMPFTPLMAALGIYFALPGLRVAALPAQTSALMGRLPHADRSEGAGTNQAARVGAASGATAVAGYGLENVAVAVPFLGYAAALVANAYLYLHFFGWDGERLPALAEESERTVS